MRLTFLALVTVALLLFSSSATAVITETGTLNTDGNEVGITVDGNHAYIAARFQGLYVIDVSDPASPSEVGSYNTPGQARKVVKDGDYCYVADFGGGLVIIDVTDPSDPSLEGWYNTSGRSNGIAVYGDYCYVADGVCGLHVFNIDDPTDPLRLDTLDTNGAAQDVVVSSDGNTAYVADSLNGLVVVDVSDPGDIALAGSLETDGIALAIAISDDDEYVYIADATNGLRIIDVTTPAAPSEVGALEGFDAQDVVLSGEHAYIADNEFLLYMANILDPENPYGVQLYDEANNTPSNGVAVSGDFAYVVGNDGGLWILNKSNLTWEKSVPRREYFMFGIPINVNVVNGDASDLFRDDFSDEDPGAPNWRVSRWDVPNQTYLRYSENNYPIDAGGEPPGFLPGRGFWVKQFHTNNCKMGIIIGQNSGFVPDTSRYELALQSRQISGEDTLSGLNMIANPYPYEYDWRQTSFRNVTRAQTMSITDAVAADWVHGYGYTWNDTTDEYEVLRYTGATQPYTVDTWEGFWCLVCTTDVITVRFKPNQWNGGLSPQYPDDEVEGEGWELNLQVRAVDGLHQDTDNMLAINPEAEEGYDGFDAFEFTPVSDSFVHLYFPHPDWSAVYGTRYTYDFRSEFDGQKVWDFIVRTWYLPETEFEITWPDIDEIPATYQFVLENADTDEVIGDLRELNSYEFTSTDANDEMYNYRISVTYTPAAVDAEPDLTADSFELLSAYPNPFNDEVRVSFILPASQQIVLSVFNLQGREIAVLSKGLLSTGEHHVTWDASGLKSGIYFLSLKSGNVSTTEKVILLR